MKQYLKSHLIDFFLCLGLALVSLCMMLGFIFSQSQKNMVASIYIGNTLNQSIDLSKETTKREFVIQGIKSEMTIAVEHNSIAVVESHCPSQFCVHSSPLTTSGRIVCTYNQVLIEVGSSQYDVEVNG